METTEKKAGAGKIWLRMKRRRILEAATHLFLTLGYEGTTMKAVAESADCSVGYLYKLFSGKDELLTDLLMAHVDVFEAIRDQVRNTEKITGLDALHLEHVYLCDYLVDHRALIPVFAQKEPVKNDEMLERFKRIRAEDISLLERAGLAGEIPATDTALLAAAADGAFWAVLKVVAATPDRDVFLSIPDMVDGLIFEPLRRRAFAGAGKEPQQ